MSLDIEGVLSAHEYEISYRPTSICRCGFSPSTALTGRLTPQQDYHRAHVVVVLREQIDGALAEAWDEGLSVGSVAGYYGPRNPRNPYRAAHATVPPARTLPPAHLSDTERAGDAE